ncbi:sensor histidine kinase [Rodentibacter caecimuris]|uniref:sensor histidine kinase n=1 Tax=Rodentibacter caecimuris TaxID=1796644 RepID=UPI002119D55C|nr:HAMP domain-containing sensor histidine kinase [Rodentibacter heylii]MCQ9124210.1 HAMP domain-containing histidine kinase [Rodentibacter heylii]MCX2961853.1 HAMP domain-containing histidine kinase [Rodentibacter heylii]
MKNSLQLRLTLAFTALFTLVALSAGGMAFYNTYRETNKLQDEMLERFSGSVNLSENPTALLPSKMLDGRVRVYFDRNRPDVPSTDFPPQMAEGFHNLKKEGKKYRRMLAENMPRKIRPHQHEKNADQLYRTYVRNTPQGRIIVIQDNSYREALAFRQAWTSVLPLLVLFPLVILLTMVIVRLAMKPVQRLSKKVEQRHEQNLQPLPTDYLPTEIRGFVVEINRLLSRINGFIQQQKRFIADASHELRSPMTALSLQVERLTTQNLPTEVNNQIRGVKQGIQRSRHLLEQLLSLARLQNQGEKIDTEVKIQTIFRQVIEDLLPLELEKQQDLGVEGEQDITFYGNDTDLYLLIKTLTDNAIRYTPNGSQIDLSTQAVPEGLILKVEDNGKGIPKEERQRVLDPFYRILGSEQQGSGLGLAIATEIVKHYNGTLKLKDSEKFKTGLLIEIWLPYRS